MEMILAWARRRMCMIIWEWRGRRGSLERRRDCGDGMPIRVVFTALCTEIRYRATSISLLGDMVTSNLGSI